MSGEVIEEYNAFVRAITRYEGLIVVLLAYWIIISSVSLISSALSADQYVELMKWGTSLILVKMYPNGV